MNQNYVVVQSVGESEMLRYLDRREEKREKDREYQKMIKKVDKQIRLREARMNTYRGQLLSLPNGSNGQSIRDRMVKALRPPIDLVD